MRFDLGEEQRLLADITRQFLAKELPSTALRTWIRAAGGEPYREWWRTCARLGWAGIFAPDSAGDFGSASVAPVIEAAIVSELAGGALAPSALLGSSVTAWALGHVAPDSAQLLNGVLDGTLVASFALEEASPGRGFGLVTSTARRHGQDLILTGTKINVPDATTADVFLVTCRVDDGVLLVVVPADAPGVDTAPRQALDLLREYGDIRFDDVRVPAEALTACRRGTAQPAEKARHLATCLQLAESVGALDRLSGLLLEYARERHAFGRPIGGFQALKHRIADITLWVESSKGTVDAAVDAVSSDAENADLLVSVAKSFVGDRSIRVAQQCTQMFGGIGLTWEHDAHLYLRRLTTNRALLGTPEEHRARIADVLRLRNGR